MARKEELKKYHQKCILDTAKRLFSERGVEQTTMDDIAKEAEYSKSTIYVYFKSKEEIFNHIVYENILVLKSSLEEAIRLSSSTVDCFLSFCSENSRFQKGNPLYFETAMNNIKKGEEEIKQYPILQMIVDVNEEINQIVKGFIEKGIEKKEIRPDVEPLTTAFTLWASLYGIISMTYRKEDYLRSYFGISSDEYLHQAFKTVLNSILINPV